MLLIPKKEAIMQKLATMTMKVKNTTLYIEVKRLQQFSLTYLLRLNLYIQKIHLIVPQIKKKIHLILIRTQQLRNIILKSDHKLLQKTLLSR